MRGPVLVIAPHPDDEVLGAGGTIARLSDEGEDVIVLVVTKGGPPLFDPAQVSRVRSEAEAAHSILGVSATRFLDLPAARLDTVPHSDLNDALLGAVREVAPRTVLMAFRGDTHLDHRLVFDSTMVALRPVAGNSVEEAYAYETLSETNWNAGRGISATFVPDCFVRIDGFLERKLEAMAAYGSQLREFPDERSIEALTSLASLRGATVGSRAAEAFMTIRRVV